MGPLTEHPTTFDRDSLMTSNPPTQTLTSVFDEILVTPAQGAEMLQAFMRSLSDPTLLALLRESVNTLLYSEPVTPPSGTSTSSAVTSSSTRSTSST